VAWAEGIAAIFTVALLFALLPLVGVYGAAIASTVSYGVALAVMLRRLSRRPPQAGRHRQRRRKLRCLHREGHAVGRGHPCPSDPRRWRTEKAGRWGMSGKSAEIPRNSFAVVRKIINCQSL